ncbi:MBL fold metallo-hydrolase [Arthrobacter sp. NPDC080031]|uniref:MBL fold metallo-hydrolase n=1 Tax=Arthrobacter sp. NPDC080031 TaxID=3155918 RepID=UPI00344D9BFA
MSVMPLSYKVWVAPQVPQSGRGPLPDGSTRMWSPISSTLIYGEQDAVLVDTPMTISQTDQLIVWLKGQSRRLTQLYITHGHGDHWFGAYRILEAFEDVEVLATAGTAAHMVPQSSPEFRASFWDAVFPGQIPVGSLAPTIVGAEGFHLEGHELLPVELGHTDTDATTGLHVPAADLTISGDAVYNGVHLYLAESGGIGGIDSWLAALDAIEDLGSMHVVAGHKDPKSSDDPAHIAFTREYLRDARRLLVESTASREFYEGMLALHPNRINPGALWGAAITLLPQE